MHKSSWVREKDIEIYQTKCYGIKDKREVRMEGMKYLLGIFHYQKVNVFGLSEKAIFGPGYQWSKKVGLPISMTL